MSYGDASYGDVAYGDSPLTPTFVGSNLQCYFDFAKPTQALFDSVLGALRPLSVFPLWVYDRRLGGGLADPGAWWLYALTGDQAASVTGHPNLQFIVDPTLGVVFSNLDKSVVLSLEVVVTQAAISRSFTPTFPWSIP